MARLTAAAFSAALWLGASPAWAMCAMCRKSLEEGGSGLIRGIYASIVLLASLPLAVFAAALIAYLRLRRKARASS